MSIKAKITIAPFPQGRATAATYDLTCPPDKSVTHRSVMLAAMAAGESSVLNPLMGADCRSTIAAMRALGVQIEEQPAQGETPARVRVSSPGWDGWRSPTMPLDFGNSGTTARLLTGVFAATPGLFVTCFGDASLSQRPMARVVKPLRAMGAQITGREDGQLLPLAISGSTLKATTHRVDKATAQVKSAILLAGLNTKGFTQVTLPAGSRDHTEKMLAALGAELTSTQQGGLEIVGVAGPFRPPARDHLVPGDPSSAAFFAVLAAISASEIRIRGVLDNQTRTGFLTILSQMGARIERLPRPRQETYLEPTMDLLVQGGVPLHAVTTDAAMAATFIDEVPILAIAAAFACGTSRFRGLGELRVKESDRLAKVLELLRAVGVKASAEGDDLLVTGTAGAVPGFTYDPAEDHRLAMTAAVLAKVATDPCVVHDPDCVAVSFPDFFTALQNER